MGWKTRTGT